MAKFLQTSDDVDGFGYHILWGLPLVALTMACGEGSGEATGGGGADSTGAMAQGVGGSGGAGGEEPVSPLPEDPYESPPPPTPLTDSQLDELNGQIAGALAGFGSQTHSVLVVNADTGQEVYARNANGRLKPASNMKLVTTAAAFDALGEDHRHDTAVYATSAPEDGVVNGDLILFGDHDYTWSTRFYPSARSPLDELAQQLAADGLTMVMGNVQARFEHLYDGYNFGTYSTTAHRQATASAFSAALSSAGVTVGGTSTSSSNGVPSGAVELGHFSSMPLSVGAAPLNRISHNEFADILFRHVGWVVGADSSYDGGENEARMLFTNMGVETNGLVFDDGSGLSHGNRISARHLVALMDYMRTRPDGLAWERTFAIAGVQGTIASRMTGPSTWGRFWGKTGTLSDTIALSGVLDHRIDGQRYHIALLMNGVTSQSASRGAHDAVVRAVAANVRGWAPPPPAPELRAALSDGNGQSVVVHFDPVEGATRGYLLWRSRDGRVWPREEARFITATTHRTHAFEDCDELYLRVTAVGEQGESIPSDVYPVAVGARSRIALIDGNDRWQATGADAENPRGEGHDFLAAYADVIDAQSFDSCAHHAVVEGLCPLDDYDLVVWALGEESATDVTFSPGEQELVRAYQSGGGALLVSGAELGWHLGQGSAQDVAFLDEVLGATYVGDDAGTFRVTVGSSPVMTFLTPARMVIGFPDLLAPADGAEPFASYVGGEGDVAGVLRDRTVTLGFPFESIAARDDRQLLWEAIRNAQAR